MARWFTSDLHLGHERIMELAGRPFASVDDMNADLVARFSSVLSPDDELWILGDAVMGPFDAGLELLGSIPARLVIVGGNHDKFHPSYLAGRVSEPLAFDGSNASAKDLRRLPEFRARYEALGNVEAVLDGPVTLDLSDGTTVLVNHFPYAHSDARSRTRSTGEVIEDMFINFRPADTGLWLFHGHVHDRWMQHDRQINVGVDAFAGMPVGQEVLEGLVAAGPARRPAMPWPSRPAWTHDSPKPPALLRKPVSKSSWGF